MKCSNCKHDIHYFIDPELKLNSIETGFWTCNWCHFENKWGWRWKKKAQRFRQQHQEFESIAKKRDIKLK